jgi:hypothetical protein
MPASPEQKEHALDRATKVYRALKSAAEAGLPCPTNPVLAKRIGCGVATIVRSMHFLEVAGMIDVERFGCTRRVTITATGHSTPCEAGKPHWSEREVA